MVCVAPLVLLYGGPYCAVSLVPPSSAVAVAAKSAGWAVAQLLSVTLGSSGEPRTRASSTVSTTMIETPTVNSLNRSYSRSLPRQGVPAMPTARDDIGSIFLLITSPSLQSNPVPEQ